MTISTPKKTTQPSQSKTAEKQKQTPTIKCTEFDINKFFVEEVDPNSEINKQAKGQLITFPRYKYTSKTISTLSFKTKPIKMTQYGIKKIDGDYIKDDSQRDYMKIPYDESQESCVELFSMLETIDKYFQDNKELVLGNTFKKAANKFNYIPIVRTPVEQDDEDETKKPKEPRMKYAKIKFDTDFRKNKELKTFVFVRENGVPELCKDLKTITQLTEHLKYMSICQFIISASKVWYSKSANATTKLKDFGISFKCPQMEVIDKPSSGSKQDFAVYSFGDNNTQKEEDEEEEEEEEEEEKKDTKQVKKSDKKAKKDESEEEQEDEEGEESEDEVENEAEDKSDGEEEEDKSEEEEEEEEQKPKPKPKLKAKKDLTPKKLVQKKK